MTCLHGWLSHSAASSSTRNFPFFFLLLHGPSRYHWTRCWITSNDGENVGTSPPSLLKSGKNTLKKMLNWPKSRIKHLWTVCRQTVYKLSSQLKPSAGDLKGYFLCKNTTHLPIFQINQEKNPTKTKKLQNTPVKVISFYHSPTQHSEGGKKSTFSSSLYLDTATKYKRLRAYYINMAQSLVLVSREHNELHRGLHTTLMSLQRPSPPLRHL